MTITATDINDNTTTIECDEVKFYEDCMTYFVDGVPLGSVPLGNLVAITQD